VRVAVDRHFYGSHPRGRPAADFGDAAQDRRVEVARPAPVADPDRHVLENHKAPLVPQGLPVDAAFPDRALTMLALEIIHG